MRKMKFTLGSILLGLIMLGAIITKAQPFIPNGGRTYCTLNTENCSTGVLKITPTFNLHVSILDPGTYRVQIKLYRGEWKQTFNTGQVINEVQVGSALNSPSVVFNTLMIMVDFDMGDFFTNTPMFTGTNQNGIYRARTTLQRLTGGVWVDEIATSLENAYTFDDVPPLDPCTYCNEMLEVEGMKRGPFFNFSINGFYNTNPPHEFFSCSGVPLILHAIGWTGSTDFSTLEVTKGLWNNGTFIPTASPVSMSIYESNLWMDVNLTTAFSLSGYSSYLRVTYTLSPDVCDGITTPVTKTQIIKVSPATFLGDYLANCAPCNGVSSKPFSVSPTIITTMPSSTSLPTFKCQILNTLGWAGASSIGINSFTFNGIVDIDVYEADAISGNRKVVGGISAPSVYLRHENTTVVNSGYLSFNEGGYSAKFSAAHPPFYVDPSGPADATGNSIGFDFFKKYYESACSTSTLAAYSDKVFCVEVNRVADGGCIVSKKNYFRIANNGYTAGCNGQGAKPTGLDEVAHEEAVLLNVTPNPSTGIFTLNCVKETNFKVLDMTGRSIIKAVLKAGSNYTLDLSRHAKGIYLLQLNSEGKIQTRKLILQ